MLLRADVGRLPFKSESLGAIHAGAALHCWPNPSQAVSYLALLLCAWGSMLLRLHCRKVLIAAQAALHRLAQRPSKQASVAEAAPLQMAEISRVLKPGGVFVASTILSAVSPLGQLIGDDNTRFLTQLDPMLFPGTSRAYKW